MRGHAVADVVHLLAELVENATVFSAPDTDVVLRAERVTAGIAVEVEDRGLGMPAEEQHRMNALLADPDQISVRHLLADGRIGLFVVSALARRHGIAVELKSNIYGGVLAVLVLPQELLGAEAPTAADAAGGSRATSWGTGQGVATPPLEPVRMPLPTPPPEGWQAPGGPGAAAPYDPAPHAPAPRAPAPHAPAPYDPAPHDPEPHPAPASASPAHSPSTPVPRPRPEPRPQPRPAPLPAPRSGETDGPGAVAWSAPAADPRGGPAPAPPTGAVAWSAPAPEPEPAADPAPDAGDRPRLPRRRAQEHLAPQLREAPAPRRAADPEQPVHDPGLMAAFQRGFGLAQSENQA